MKQNYISPDYGKASFTCPHCGTLSLMHYDTFSFRKYRMIRHDGFISPAGDNWVYIASCHNCEKKIIWINNIYTYPDIAAEEANPDMPEDVLKLYNEASLIYTKSPRAACALLRLAIDRLCNELGETDRDINKNIGELVKKGLPIPIQQALDVVRVIGNKAVHPGQIAFDVDDTETAIMLMHLLNIIVERMISEPKEIAKLYNRLPQAVKNSIDKRDN